MGVRAVRGVLGAEESRGLEAHGSHPVKWTLKMNSKDPCSRLLRKGEVFRRFINTFYCGIVSVGLKGRSWGGKFPLCAVKSQHTGISWPQSWQRPEILLGPVPVLPACREAIPLPGRMPQLSLRGGGSHRKATRHCTFPDRSSPFLSPYSRSDHITLQLNALLWLPILLR